MAKSVVEGLITQLSPSSINAFDNSTPFGCKRRWHFKYVQGLEEPSTGGQNLGTDVHAINETHLVHGPDKVTPGGATAFNPEAFRLYQQGWQFLETLRPRLLSSEQLVKGELLGIPLIGYIDVLADDPAEVVDFKTTANIRKYGKTAKELETDTQMILYGRFGHPDATEVKLTHAQYQTKGDALFKTVSTTVSRNHIDSVIGERILPVVSEMVQAAKGELIDLPRIDDDWKCRICPFKSNCPTAQGAALMSFLNRFAATTAAPATASIVPNDAPVSQPAQAADPVEPKPGDPAFIGPLTQAQAAAAAPTPPQAEPSAGNVPAPRRGPGRPPGSKNKPKDRMLVVNDPDPVPEEVAQAAAIQTVPEAPKPVMVVKKITLAHGLTIPDVMGRFSGARVDVTLEAEVNGDLNVAWTSLAAEVQAKLEGEAKPYLELAAAAAAANSKKG